VRSVTDPRSGPPSTGASARVGAKLGDLFDATGRDRDGLSARDVTTLLPRTIDALRSLVARDPNGQRGVPIERLRVLGTAIAPRLPVRDLDTLQRHHNGRSGDELADALAKSASTATGMAGVVGGSLVFATKRTQAVVLSIPLRIAAEAVVVAAIEIKLVGELHEVYGRSLGRTSTERAQGALRRWAAYRGVEGADAGGLISVFGKVLKRPAQRRAAGGAAGRLLGRRAAILGASMTGGAENRRETLALADQVRADLRRPDLRAIDGGSRR
jgi:hypothetical protein